MTSLTPIIMAPLAAMYGAVTQVRSSLYHRGLLPVSKLAGPVISVGNITTGGTGKTPLVEFIARELANKGKKICVLTRGYGRQESGERVLVSDREQILADVRAAGDEPRLLAEKLLGISAVISDANRFAAGEWATRNLGSEVFILDDGFQHLNVARNLDVVAIDATEPWGHGHLLPWGRLREPPQGLARADCVVITRADQAENVGALRQEIERRAPDKPVFSSRMKINGLHQLQKPAENQLRVPAKIADLARPVAAFCGVGNPTSFIRLLRDSGCDPLSTTVFPDHHKYRKSDIDNIVEKAKAAGARSLITTAKDAVKLRAFTLELPCSVLEIEVSIDEESRFLEMVHRAAAVGET